MPTFVFTQHNSDEHSLLDRTTGTTTTTAVNAEAPTTHCKDLSLNRSSESLVPSRTDSPSLSLSPPFTPTFAPSLSSTSSCSSTSSPPNELEEDHDEPEPRAPAPAQQYLQDLSPTFALVTHPAVVFASERLSDGAYTSQFHTVNVFDFDQTLFQSPLPNPALWDPSFLGILTSWNYCGSGWWHNPGTLELGSEVEATCWAGWWNEDVVKRVQESSEDPGCLTVLLTGRNGPTFGRKLIEMVRCKGLDFDLIATKPTTVARIENSKVPFTPTKKIPKPVERYLKVHTFNTKHDFLYNLLFEYPAIRSMHLWDDRPCQVAKFRQVGQEWLDNKMLDQFEITVVQEPLLYLDPKREVELVLAMVEANNQQVDIEASGGPFMVPGVGAVPRTRPELKDRNMWDPYETYIPQTRLKIEVTTIVRYTGVLFSGAVQKIMREHLGNRYQGASAEQWIERPRSLRDHDLSRWVIPEDLHVTLCLGPAPAELLETIGGLGSTVLVEVEKVGQYEGRIWALKVKELTEDGEDHRELQIVAPSGHLYPDLESLRSAYLSCGPVHTAPTSSCLSGQEITAEIAAKYNGGAESLFEHVDLNRLGHVILKRDGTPHITMAYDRLNGTRAVDSNKITEWELLTTLSKEQQQQEETPFSRRLVFVGRIGEKRLLGMKPRKPPQSVARAEVSVGNIIKSLTGDKHISGKELGEMIQCVKEEMERLSVENRLANEERIATIAQEVCDRVETMKSAQHSPALSA